MERILAKLPAYLEFLRPYVKSSQGLVPLHKLTHIRGYKVARNKMIEAVGSCNYEAGKFSINLCTHDQIWGKTSRGHYRVIRYKRRYLYDILQVLAHELAHLKHWEHTPEHAMLEARISRRFAKKARQLGVQNMYSLPKKR